MPRLVRPDPAWASSFADGTRELLAEGGIVFPPVDEPTLADPARRDAFVRGLRHDHPEIPGSGRVPVTMFWWVEGDRWLGRIDLRHTLTEGLRDVGGHIGYEVRPPDRRRGHATAMLAAVLPHAAALGIDPALLTCDADHDVSRRILEGAGGTLVSRSERTLRFRVPTTATGRGVRGR